MPTSARSKKRNERSETEWRSHSGTQNFVLYSTGIKTRQDFTPAQIYAKKADQFQSEKTHFPLIHYFIYSFRR